MRQIIISYYGQSEAAPYPTPGIKMKASSNMSVFFKETKIPEFPEYHYTSPLLRTRSRVSPPGSLLRLLQYGSSVLTPSWGHEIVKQLCTGPSPGQTWSPEARAWTLSLITCLALGTEKMPEMYQVIPSLFTEHAQWQSPGTQVLWEQKATLPTIYKFLQKTEDMKLMKTIC